MKKILIICIACLSIATINYAQSKEELVDKIQNESSWVKGEIVKECITINASEDLWTRLMLRKNAYGVDAFEAVSVSLVYYSDKVLGSLLERNCGLSNTTKNMGNKVPECEADIQSKVKGKISITINADKLKVTDISQKMAMGTFMAVGDFLNASNGDFNGVKGGWRPKSKSVSIIMNMENSSGSPTVKWNTDFSVATITVHTASEPAKWSTSIINGLVKGGGIAKQ